MKMLLRIYLSVALYLFTCNLFSQEKPQLEALQQAEAEGAPLMFSFEPAFKTVEQQEREELEQKIAVIDTLEIPESQKYKLIRDLYRKRDSRRLQKVFFVGTRYEQEDEIEQ